MPAFTLTRSRALLLVVGALALVLVCESHAPAGAVAADPAADPLGRSGPCRGPSGFSAGMVVVDVAGAVRRAGLYRLPQGARIADAIARAGGASGRADTGLVNLAAPLADGEQVLVPARGAGASSWRPDRLRRRLPSTSTPPPPSSSTRCPVSGPSRRRRSSTTARRTARSRSVDELDAIPGIGPARIDNLRGLVVAVNWVRAPAHILAASLCLGLALANVGRVARVRARRLAACGVRRRRSPMSPAVRLACAALLRSSRVGWWWASERLDALDRSPLAAEIGRAGDAIVVVTSTPRRRTVLRAGTGTRPQLRAASRSTSPCSSSCRSVARRRRARSWTRSPSSGLRRARRTGSTSARGCAVTASTSYSGWTRGGRSAGAAVSAASPIASARDSSVRSRPGLRESGARSSTASSSATTPRSPTAYGRTSAPRGCTTSSP